MDEFAQSSAGTRHEGFVQTAAARQMTPLIVEKDFWVCWTLKELFGLRSLGDHLIFKGGTSLSKAFEVIEQGRGAAAKSVLTIAGGSTCNRCRTDPVARFVGSSNGGASSASP